MAFAKRVRRLNPSRAKNPRRRFTRAQIKAGFGGKRRQNALHRKRKNPAPKVRVVTRYRYRTKYRTRVVRKGQKNPAVLLTYAPAMNPQERKHTVARKKKTKKSQSRHDHRVYHAGRQSNPKVIYRFKARKRKSNPKRQRNPINFGAGHGAVATAKAVAAGLVGVTITKTVPSLIASMSPTLLSSPLMRVVVSAATAFASGALATKMLGRDVGHAVMFGGFMQAGSVALNAFVPSIGSVIGLQGLRGLVPSNDILLPYNMLAGRAYTSPAPMDAAGGFAPAFANA